MVLAPSLEWRLKVNTRVASPGRCLRHTYLTLNPNNPKYHIRRQCVS